MTIKDVQDLVADIERNKRDPEMAHGFEDDLYRLVLEEIAYGLTQNPQELAEAALEAQDIDFPRWSA
jgi:hypothetical protein